MSEYMPERVSGRMSEYTMRWINTSRWHVRKYARIVCNCRNHSKKLICHVQKWLEEWTLNEAHHCWRLFKKWGSGNLQFWLYIWSKPASPPPVVMASFLPSLLPSLLASFPELGFRGEIPGGGAVEPRTWIIYEELIFPRCSMYRLFIDIYPKNGSVL